MKTYILLIVAIFFCFLYGCPTRHVSKVPSNNDTAILPEKNAQHSSFYRTIKVGSSPLSPLAVDFNNDGFMDIAAISHGDNKLVIFWGGPGRTFRKGPVYGKDMVGYHPGKIVAVDWNHDGLKDIILAAEGTYQVQYWQNTGNGFAKKAQVKVPINCLNIRSADLDDDGNMDLVIGPYSQNAIVILWNKGDEFSFTQQIIRTNPRPRNIETGDWNTDRKKDIFWVELVNGSVAIALNDGDRHFHKIYLKKPGKPIGLAKDAPDYIKLGDLNQDGCPDAVVTFEVLKERACTIFYGDCNEGVAFKEYISAPDWGFRGLAISMYNDLPLIALGEEGQIIVAKKKKRKWELAPKPAGSLPKDISFEDVDRDGYPDIIFANGADTSIGIIFGPL